MIGMPSLKLCLPNMMVRIDESWRYNLSRAVNHLGLGGWGRDMGGDLGDLVVLDQQRVSSERHHVVIGLSGWDEDGRIP